MKRIFIGIFVASLFFAHADADLMYDTVYKSFEWRSADGNAKVRHKGPLNLMLGLLANKTGFVYNKRFFSPYVKVTYEININNKEEPYRRAYNRDMATSENAFYSTMIDLFPSSGGRISIAMVRDDSFYNVLSKNRSSEEKRQNQGRERAIRFMAALTAMALGVDIKCESKMKGKKKSITIMTSTPIRVEGTKLYQVDNAVKFFSSAHNEDVENMSTIEDFARSRLFLAQGFLTHCLDTEKDANVFFDNMYDLLRGTSAYDSCFVAADEEDEVDYKLLKDAVEMNGVFPFSPTNQPPSNIIVPQYNRTADEFLSEPFSDCAEITLLEFFCCILYDSRNMMYSTEKIPDDAKRFKEFFNEYRNVFAFTLECRKSWLRVVADIEKNIEYWKVDTSHNNAKNDMKPGFLNMITAIEYICCLKKETKTGKPGYVGIWRRIADATQTEIDAPLEDEISGQNVKKPSGYAQIRSVFEEEFRKLVSTLCNKKIAVTFNNMSVEERKDTNRTWDVYGSIYLSIEILENVVAKVELRHQMGHAQLYLIQSPQSASKQQVSSIAKRTNKYMNADSLVERLIGKYAHISISTNARYNTFYEDVCACIQHNNIDDALLCGSLERDEHKMQVLDVLFPYIAEKDADERLQQLAINIVASSSLNMFSAINTYGSFIYLVECINKEFGVLITSYNMEYYSFLWEASLKGCVNIGCYYINVEIDRVKKMETPLHLLFLLIKHKRTAEMKLVEHLYEDDANFLSAEMFQAATMAYEQEYATRLFDKVGADYLANCNHSALCDETVSYFEERIENSSIDVATLKKIYCWYFYTKDKFVSERLIHLVEKTHHMLSMDFIYDFTVKYPGCFVVIRFYKFLLEMALRENIKIRNDVLWMMIFFGRHFSDDLTPVEVPGRLSFENEVFEVINRNLVDRQVVFEHSYASLALNYYVSLYRIYTFQNNHGIVTKQYISAATSALKEGKKCRKGQQTTYWVFLAADVLMLTFFAVSVWRSIRRPS